MLCHRHCSNDEFNATEIVTVAGASKHERQQILEQYRGMSNVEQGGNARMQGVWVCYDDAQKLCDELGVSAKFRNLMTVNKSRLGCMRVADRDNRKLKQNAKAVSSDHIACWNYAPHLWNSTYQERRRNILLSCLIPSLPFPLRLTS